MEVKGLKVICSGHFRTMSCNCAMPVCFGKMFLKSPFRCCWQLTTFSKMNSVLLGRNCTVCLRISYCHFDSGFWAVITMHSWMKTSMWGRIIPVILHFPTHNVLEPFLKPAMNGAWTEAPDLNSSDNLTSLQRPGLVASYGFSIWHRSRSDSEHTKMQLRFVAYNHNDKEQIG